MQWGRWGWITNKYELISETENAHIIGYLKAAVETQESVQNLKL